MKALTLLSAGAILAGIVIPTALASSAYTCTVFEPNPAAPTNILVTGINNKGQVVGSWYGADQIFHAFLRNADGTITVPTSPRGSDQFTPAGINNLGQIAGQVVTNQDPFTVSESFILNPDGSHIDIAPAVAPPGHTYGPPQITGINDNGELDGTIFDQFEVFLIFIRDTNGRYSIIDQIATDHVPILGTINNSDVLLEHGAGTGYDGFLLRRDGSEITLLYPGIQPFGEPQPTTTNGLNNNNVTSGDLDAQYDGGITTAFLRTLDGHYPSIVCPGALTAQLDVGAINDNNVVAGRIFEQVGSADRAVFIATPTGLSPQAQLSNASWTFASHGLGETSGVGRVFLSNTGRADLHIPSMYIGPTAQTSDRLQAFQITRTNCGQRNPDAQVALGTVAPGGSCFVEFTFTPRSPGWQSAALYIPTDSPDSPQTIQLGGTGIASTMQVSNRSWTFGSHPVGETSGKGVIYAYNAGPATITFQNVHVFESGGQSDFNLINNTCNSLAPFTTCAFTFDFTPKTPGDHAATLSIVNDSLNGPNHIPLRGHGN